MCQKYPIIIVAVVNASFGDVSVKERERSKWHCSALSLSLWRYKFVRTVHCCCRYCFNFGYLLLSLIRFHFMRWTDQLYRTVLLLSQLDWQHKMQPENRSKTNRYECVRVCLWIQSDFNWMSNARHVYTFVYRLYTIWRIYYDVNMNT